MATKTKKGNGSKGTRRTIQRDTTKGSQSWNLLAVYAVRMPRATDEVKLRVEVKIDSYDQQSFARCKVWSGATMSWNLIADIPFGAMQGLGAGYSRTQPVGLARNEDRLLKLAEEVLQ